MARRWLAGESQASIAKSYTTHSAKVGLLMRAQGPEIRAKAWYASRSKHGMWKGGRFTDPHGYIRVLVEPTDPLIGMAMQNGYALEHRLVMARMLGRPLTRKETVHHINGNTADNRPENLQLRNGRHGVGVVLVCAHCGSHDIVATPLASVA
jgi:HNH endonuclease